ncbi:uncharacterized protein LOC112431478 [Maylandia zebra]|uniref:uncharacterized protein LOC112431478 n=1 Tax=Maylandia zebra TaxID=106582 RepID=UPI00403D19A4
MDLTSACCSVIFTCLLSAVCSTQKNITAESGQDITLTCRAPNNNITVLDWSKPDLKDSSVLFYDKKFNTTKQHPSFKNRVALQDRQMKDGDVSLILKNVTVNDTGTYECGVIQKRTDGLKLLCSITLSVVDPPGQTGGDTEDGGKEDGGKEEDEGKQDEVNSHYGLVASGLLLLVLLVALVIASKLPNRNSSNHLPSDEPADICSEIRVSAG